MSDTLNAVRTDPAAGHWRGARLLQRTVADNLAGRGAGIYSVCCSHPLVVEAAVDQVVADGTTLLVEATANQVNQDGGYTGMTPSDYAAYVAEIASRRGLPIDRVVLGGDHLGPVCWTKEPAESAMAKAEVLVAAFATAGFEKIHLDCSMSCADDPSDLGDEIIAQRAARLCSAAEAAAEKRFGTSGITYIVGTEVPPPGGADEALHEVEVTPSARARATLDIHRDAFSAAGLTDAWSRVIALVVQPGVEFDNSAVVDYRPEKATELKSLAEAGTSGVAFEAHSTDYQRPQAFAQLVRDHFAILKVGPGLTFALREALFALADIEDALLPQSDRSNLRDVCERRMMEEPKHWQRFYEGDEAELALLRRYSLSDRIRYYWPDSQVDAASRRLFANLEGKSIPLGLLSQYLPGTVEAVRNGDLPIDPESLAKAHVRAALAPYAAACIPAGEAA